MDAIYSALKEWAIAITALAQGQTILLMRKGGIREDRGRFSVPHRRVWLYPTYEHQRPHLLKPDYAAQVTTIDSGWHPQSVPILAWADITHVLQVKDADAVAALMPFHIWSDRFTTERLHWKPNSPFYLLLLRVHVRSHPYDLPVGADYGGCRSWIELKEAIAPLDSSPALTDAAYQHQVKAIHARLQAF